MSVYAQAVMTFASAFDDHDTSAGANAAYSAAMQRHNSRQQARNAGINIAKVKDSSMLAITNIEMNKLEAEAQATLSSAVSGTEGGSVDAQLRDIDTNAANRTNQVHAQTEVQIANEAAAMASAESNARSIKQPKVAGVNYAAIMGRGLAQAGGALLEGYAEGTLPWQVKAEKQSTYDPYGSAMQYQGVQV